MVLPAKDYSYGQGPKRHQSRHPFRRKNRAAGRQASAGGRRVPFGRAPLRPDERPDVGRAAPGLEGRAGQRGPSAQGRQAIRPARSRRCHRRRGVPRGGSRRAKRARHCLRHQCRHAQRRPRTRARTRARLRGDLRARQCRSAALSESALRLRHHRLRHPQRAAHRTRAGRGLSRAADRRALPVPGIFFRRLAGPKFAVRRLFLQRHPAHRRGGHRRPRRLQVSGGIDPQVSQAAGLREDDRGGRLPPRLVYVDDRRRGGAAFGLEVVISALSHLSRRARAGFVFAREGVFALVDTRPLPLPAKTAIALARLIERPTAKDGSSRLAAALTKPVADVYASFGPAVAAASIAQVHRAQVAREGVNKPMAVKILRPNIERRFKSDLDAFFYAARKAESLSIEAQRLRPVEAVATLARSVTMEMDFRLETAALSEMAENTRVDLDFRVPTVDWDRTAREVLTLEWIDGTPLNDRAALEARGLDLPALGHTVLQSFLRHALRDGFFHADMHPGNLFVDDNGRLGAVDFGIMGRLGPKERRFLAEIL